MGYDNIGRSIAAYERSSAVTKFSSKFDRFVAEQGGDVSDFGVNANRKYLGPSDGFESSVFTYDKADGLALFNADSTNDGGMCYLCHLTTAYDADTPPILTDFSYDNLGIPLNPRVVELLEITDYPYATGLGLGGREDIADPAEYGKFKVPTLRNVARTAPYGHNGYFPTLYDVVHFLNERDSMGLPAKVEDNVNDIELGNLGLSFQQEMKLVLFLETLTD